MTDTRTKYLGFELPNPIVASASPLSRSVDMAKRLEDAGASAVVMYSLFEEQISRELEELDNFMDQGTESFAESVSYFPSVTEPQVDPDMYLQHLQRLKGALSIPVIGSLNGDSPGGWTSYARYIAQAGADALELNFYYVPTDPALPGSIVEDRYVETLREVKAAVDIPVAVKLSPYFSNIANLSKKLVEAGADGLVMFNRFYQPDIDLEDLEVVPDVQLSLPHETRLPLRWIAILYGHVDASLAATSGVHDHTDVLKLLMSGADVTMMCSALLKNGPEHIRTVLADLRRWMDEREYDSVRQMKGSMSHRAVRDPSKFERAHYMRALNSFEPPFLRHR